MRPLKRILKKGMEGEDVAFVQSKLTDSGYYKGYINGKFGDLTRGAVIRFQMTHVGPDRKFLTPDGIVGPNTWWALMNPAGEEQRSYVKALIPENLPEERWKVLSLALKEYQEGVHEEPLGSNWGDGIIKYGGLPGWPWCALFVSWVFKQAVGYYPTGRKEPSTYKMYRYFVDNNKFYSKNSLIIPSPGDIFIMLYRNSQGKLIGKGHVGFVLSSNAKREFNTIEGNVSHRVKVGYRTKDTRNLIGFANPYRSPESQKVYARESKVFKEISGILDDSFKSTR